MTFKTPLLLLLIPVILAILWIVLRRRRAASIRFSSTAILPQGKRSWRQRCLALPLVLRVITLVLFCVALAGPRLISEYSEVKAEGIDIVLVIDVSGSMAGEDFVVDGKRQSRLDAVKGVVRDFIKARRDDRIGITAFASQAYTVSPLTSDQDWLLSNLKRLRLGLIKDGTAVGSGLSSALVRLKGSKAKSKIVILLTDGVNNAGKISPLEAAQIAKTMGIKVYTIGAGTRGLVPFPVEDMWGRKGYQQVRVPIDEQTLKRIAQETGGQYFRADNTESLRAIYNEIDKMEKTEIKQYGYREYKELFPWFVIAGLILLILEILLKNTILLVLP